MANVSFEIEYNRVFDENGDVRLCGRDACRALMLKMEECFPDEKFGNVDTGFIDILKVRRFYRAMKDIK